MRRRTASNPRLQPFDPTKLVIIEGREKRETFPGPPEVRSNYALNAILTNLHYFVDDPDDQIARVRIGHDTPGELLIIVNKASYFVPTPDDNPEPPADPLSERLVAVMERIETLLQRSLDHGNPPPDGKTGEWVEPPTSDHV